MMRSSALILAAALSLLSSAAFADDIVGDCHIGAYRLSDDTLVDIGASSNNLLRWRRFDGTTGALHPHPDQPWTSTAGWSEHEDGVKASFPDCDSIDFNGTHGRRIAFDVTDTSIKAKGVTLAGRLVLPKGDGPVPIVVLLHGSEHYSGRDFYSLQRLLPAEGIGVFVYDKRGTGKSEGKYTQDFSLLADDAVAAMTEARRLAGARAGRVGFQGGSQGGWIAPLAATRTRADFVVVSFGLAVSPIEEDQEEVALEMALKGHSPAEIAKAEEVAAAAATLMTSHFTQGFDRFDAVRAKYRDEPWYKDLHGNFTVELLPFDKAQLLAHKSDFVMGTPMHYDAMPVLRRVTTPQLWILGRDDLAAPSAETSRRLLSLADRGKPITLAVFPNAEHGIYEYELDAAGERVDLRNSDGYFAMMHDYIRGGRLAGTYGQSTVIAPHP